MSCKVWRRENGCLADGRLTGRWESVVGAELAEWLLLPADHRGTCRVLVLGSGVRIEPVNRPTGLAAAGVRHVTASDLAVDDDASSPMVATPPP
jgi:3-hydroxy-9,10-secoandrosta-1,3,5(10)-triene-9,17-dione monooxygenase